MLLGMTACGAARDWFGCEDGLEFGFGLEFGRGRWFWIGIGGQLGLRGGFGIGDGQGLIEVVVDDFADDFFGGDFGFDLGHLFEGFEGGLHEVGECGDLAEVDGVAGEGVGDGVDIGEDGEMVLHVVEGDDGGEGEVVGDGRLDAEDLVAVSMLITKVFAVEGGRGAAGSAEGEVAAAGVVGRCAAGAGGGGLHGVGSLGGAAYFASRNTKASRNPRGLLAFFSLFLEYQLRRFATPTILAWKLFRIIKCYFGEVVKT